MGKPSAGNGRGLAVRHVDKEIGWGIDMTDQNAIWEKIRKYWVRMIDQNVDTSSLYAECDRLHERGYHPDYIGFVIYYAVKHGLKLNFPGGIKYYMDMPKIKGAYTKYLMKRSQEAKPVNYDNTPSCAQPTHTESEPFAQLFKGKG